MERLDDGGPIRTATDKDIESEPWDYWLHEDLRLDATSPTEVSSSLWEGFEARSHETVARSLFTGTAASHAKGAASLVRHDSLRTRCSWHDPSPRTTCSTFALTDELAHKSPCLSDSFEDHPDASLGSVDCPPFKGPSSPGWFMANDEYLQLDYDGSSMEHSTGSWMAGCFTDSNVGVSQEGTCDHATAICSQAQRISPNKASGLPLKHRRVARPCQDLGSQHHVPTKKSVHARGKQTLRHPPKHAVPAVHTTKASTGHSVVYPFALVKPCGMHGDATLMDINERINMVPPRASSVPALAEGINVVTTSSPFSGKPVVAVTKIQTEGKGTITIMRTRSC